MTRRMISARLTMGLTVLAVGPIAYGYAEATGSQVIDSLDLFSLSMSNLLPLLFPILVAVLCLPDIADELANGHTRSVRTRTTLGRFIVRRGYETAGVAFIVFGLAVLAAWFFAFVWAPNLMPGIFTPPEPGETFRSAAERYRFSGLVSMSPVLYGIVYSAWVGVNAAAFALLGVAALVWVQNRFVALAVPFVVYWGLSIVPAVLRAESYAASTSIFPFSLVQVPAVQAIPQLLVVTSAAVVALLLARRRDYQTPGLD